MENTRLIIFDIDGTLLPGTSCERLFFQYLIDKRILTFINLFHFVMRGIFLFRKGRSFALKANKGYLRGHSYERMTKIGREFFNAEVKGRISKKGIERLEEHRGRGETIILLSGMPEFLLKNFADFLQIERYRGSVLQFSSDKISGKTIGIFPLSRGKAEIIESLIREINIGWGDITAYGDHYGDRFLLQRVGHAVAVNPDEFLRQFAKERNWPVEIWD